MDEILKDVMKDPAVKGSRGISVIFDRHTALPESAANEKVKKMAKEWGVKVIRPTISRGVAEVPELGPHDFSTGVIGEKYEKAKKENSKIIRSKTKVRKVRPKNIKGGRRSKG